VPVRSPGAAALPGTLAMARALRPLRRRMPSRTATILDEEETVRQAADGDLWIPASRPALDRWLELALVIDESASMVIWRQTTAELRDLMERMGAFRDVRVWRCDTDLRGKDRLTLRPEGATPGAAGRDVRELVDPTGRRVVLVISDCVGKAWASGEMDRALQVWGTSGPVAVVQALPQRLWAACAPSFESVRMRARRPGVPNTELQTIMEDVHITRAGIPVPVLELEARWFAPWAALISGTGPEWVSGTAIFTDGANGADGLEPEPTTIRGPAPSADDLLEHYVSFASTEAMRLAVCLAGAPLNLPVMRLVQQTMLPASKPSVLAEVFLSGLLRQRPRSLDRAVDPEEMEYDFVAGVRDKLLPALPRHDKITVLAKVSDFITARLGSPMDFRAFLAAEDSAAAVLMQDPPFARVALRVLSDMGGRYREAAERLQRRSAFPIAFPDTPGSEMTKKPTPIIQDSPGMPASPRPVLGDSVVTSAPSVLPALERPLEVAKQPTIFGGVPYRNPHFTGRVELLEQLHVRLVHGTTQMALLPHALHGLGGVGKTPTGTPPSTTSCGGYRPRASPRSARRWPNSRWR
jgi:hypothetical protein